MNPLKEIKKFTEKNKNLFKIKRIFKTLFITSFVLTILAIYCMNIVSFFIMPLAIFCFYLASRYHRELAIKRDNLHELCEYMYYMVIDALKNDIVLCNNLGRGYCQDFYKKDNPGVEEIFKICQKIMAHYEKKQEKGPR